jgi:predicted nicotinamide N-methyase
VYLKINSLIYDMVKVSGMDISSIACHKLCSK